MSMKRIILLLSIILAFAFMANAQCDISPVSAKLCKGSSITFSIAANPGSYTSIKWLFGDGDSSTQKTSIINHIYDIYGSFNVSVTLYDISGKIICGPKYSSVKVFDLPIAKFNLLTDSNQHFSNNNFKFADVSVAGNSNAPIQNRIWYFGDGDSSLLANPTHIYSGCGTYPMILIVKDTNGCLSALYKPDYIISKGPQPKFVVLDTTGCKPLTVFVKDASSSVSLWEFIKGDGTKATFTSRNPVDSIFSFVYKTDGTFHLYMIGYDSAFNSNLGKWINCSAKYGDPADPKQPHFRILIKPIYHTAFKGDTLIQTGDTATFIDLCDPAYDTLAWMWDDGSDVEIRGRGNATHVYNLPFGIDDKIYTVSLNALGSDTICPDSIRYWKIRVVRTLGIKKNKENVKIQVYPNPFTGQTNIVLPQNSKQVSEINLYDLTGKGIQVETNITGRSILLYRNQLLPGIYVMAIITDKVHFLL